MYCIRNLQTVTLSVNSNILLQDGACTAWLCWLGRYAGILDRRYTFPQCQGFFAQCALAMNVFILNFQSGSIRSGVLSGLLLDMNGHTAASCTVCKQARSLQELLSHILYTYVLAGDPETIPRTLGAWWEYTMCGMPDPFAMHHTIEHTKFNYQQVFGRLQENGTWKTLGEH